MLKVIVCRGLPASGKTTWAKKFISEQPKNTWIRVNKDDLRAMLCGEWCKGQEQLVKYTWLETIAFALISGTNVIVDDTNLNPAHLKTVQDLVLKLNDGRKKKIVVEVKKFDKSLDVCIRDDAHRANPVGAEVITSMYNRWIRGKSNSDPVYAKRDESLPEAIIVDLDGTLCLMGDRSPYDAARCGEDNVNEPVREVIDMFLGDTKAYPGFNRSGYARKVIFLSGRDSKYRTQTAEWIRHNLGTIELHEFELYMRPEGSATKDSIVKRALYEEYVMNQYNVLFVLDDRNQVVDMWRKELKLPCFQVNYGDF